MVLGLSLVLSSVLYFNLTRGVGNKRNSMASIIEGEPINKNIKTSGISGKVHINNNWSAAKAAGICTGNGIYSDPYVIKDLIINGRGPGRCISIEYTDEHFMVLNCTVFNSYYIDDPYGIRYGGIFLYDVSNGQIINNTCYSNDYGINLESSSSIIITGNNIFENDYGIYCNGREIEVSNNLVNSNNIYGIILECVADSTVTENNVTTNNVGISLLACYRILVSKNIATTNSQGMGITHGGNNEFSENNASYNAHSGIRLSYTSTNQISRNIATNNEYGVYLHNSNNNIVSGNGLTNNSICIFEENCQGNVISDNEGCNYLNNNIPPTLVFGIILILSGSALVGIIIIMDKRKSVLEKKIENPDVE